MLACGEASGDVYGAAVARHLRALQPDIELFGFGGDRMAEAGVELVGEYRQIAVTGLSQALSVIPRALRLVKQLGQMAAERRPDVFVPIDAPDFNFRLLPAMHRLTVPIVYYISPQVWAWRAGRLRVLRRLAARVLVLFPFEAALYERHGAPVEFVGHPLVELVQTGHDRNAWLRELGLDPARPVVALLPGSRRSEVHRLLPVMRRSMRLIGSHVPGVQFVVARAPSLGDDLFTDMAGEPGLRVVTDQTDATLGAADAVVTASGTATVQAALHGRPMVIVYKLSAFDYALGRLFVKVQHFGMVNLIAGRAIVPELIQHACRPEAISAEIVSMLTRPERVATIRAGLSEVRDRLGGPGASRRAADAILAVARAHRVRIAAGSHQGATP
jgi:lipid-A-disaccharide synthase